MKLIIDTNIWLLACASSKQVPEPSGIDTQITTKTKSHNVSQLRGFLCRAMESNEVIIPETIVRELRGLALAAPLPGEPAKEAKKSTVGSHNKEILMDLVGILDGVSTPFTPRQKDVFHQKAVWAGIKADPTRKESWKKKFQPYEKQVDDALKLAPGEPWIEATEHLRALQALQSHDASPGIARQVAEKYRLVREITPKLVPDFEILVMAHRYLAAVVSLDNDFFEMWEFLPQKNPNAPKPRVGVRLDDKADNPRTPAELAKTLQRRVKPASDEMGIH